MSVAKRISEIRPSSMPNKNLSDLLEGVGSSSIIDVAREIQETSKVRKVLNFSIGDFHPDEFSPPSLMISESVAALEQGYCNYPSPRGQPKLLQAISTLYNDNFGVQVDTDRIVVHTGGRPGIYATYRALVQPGETVVYPVPCWSNEVYCRMVDARQVIIRTNPKNKFLLRASDLEDHISEARLISVNSPCNPSGATFHVEELSRICQMVVQENKRRHMCGKRPVYLLLDQIYWMLTFGEAPYTYPESIVPDIADYLIVVDGISKAFAATGLRVGWTISPRSISTVIDALLSEIGTWAPKPFQEATAKILVEKDTLRTYRDSMAFEIQERLDQLIEGFRSLSDEFPAVEFIKPSGGIYALVRLNFVGRYFGPRLIGSVDELRSILLQEAGLGILPLSLFGMDSDSDWFRLSVGAVSRKDISDGLCSLRELLRKFR